jgi:hypothetical protein
MGYEICSAVWCDADMMRGEVAGGGRRSKESNSVKQVLNMKNVSSGMLRRVALARTDVSEERSASFIKVTRIGELGTTLAVTSS